MSDPNQLMPTRWWRPSWRSSKALAAALSEDEVDGVPPVQGPQDWA